MDGFLFALTLITALGCGLAAGSLFPFSTFAMAGLRRLPPSQGIAAMQSINILAVTPLFMTVLFGTGVACLGLIVWTVISPDGWTTALVLAGGTLYLVGTIGVTMAFNVPLNNALDKLEPKDAGAADRWDEYVTRWTAWNHVRIVAALAAATALTIALHV